MKLFKDMNRQEQEAYLMLPIINELKQLGGQSTTRELKREVVVDDELISENILTTYSTSSKSGRKYLPFNYPFNFAISNLVMAGMLDRPRRGTVKLTEKARKFKGSGKELSDQVYQVSLPMWHKRSRKNKESSQNDTSKAEEVDIDDSLEDANWRSTVLDALMNLSPGKFELFCRALVKQMNVDIDETIGTKLTGDGGLDGYGYIITDDFRTSRVAIQAKRWSLNNSVSSPEIDKFRGAMDKFRAEFGIFITTSTFTRDAVKASRAGTRVITLIDGDKLLDLVAKYELYVTPKVVTTYELDDFFKEKD
ncbi:Mrr restriction system protein [Lactobacillus amylovorus subsp. animalium]|uniref:restriction endonuclease n=1 Tax=Lactobacillus amylovorus TaxID=1604 RepID=UPI001474293C|nr:Mrr restriction system protein [Lactobacillus amylovorus]NME30805.1 Mrr restriction system protein [Lactobacillus amylovorus]